MASTPNDTEKTPAKRKDSEEELFMREVDEAVRKDDVSTFARRFGWPIGIALALGLAAFAGYLYWSSASEAKLEEGSEQIIAAFDELEQGDPKVADSELAVIAAEREGGIASIAILARAGIAMEQDRIADAVALFAQVADDPEAPQEMRDLAAVRMMAAQFDDVDPQQVIDRIGPIATPDNAFYGSAGELVAFAYLAQDKEDQAGSLLADIARNDDVPESIQSRARQLAGLLGHDAIEDVDEMLDELTAGTPQQRAMPAQ